MISSIMIRLYFPIISFRWSENVFRPRQFCCSLILEKIFVTSMFVAILSSSDVIGLRVPNGPGSFILGWKRVQGKFRIEVFLVIINYAFETYWYMQQKFVFIYKVIRGNGEWSIADLRFSMVCFERQAIQAHTC